MSIVCLFDKFLTLQNIVFLECLSEQYAFVEIFPAPDIVSSHGHAGNYKSSKTH